MCSLSTENKKHTAIMSEQEQLVFYNFASVFPFITLHYFLGTCQVTSLRTLANNPIKASLKHTKRENLSINSYSCRIRTHQRYRGKDISTLWFCLLFPVSGTNNQTSEFMSLTTTLYDMTLNVQIAACPCL